MAAKKNTRVCTSCKRRMVLSRFYRRGDDPAKFRSHCKDCIEARTDKIARQRRARDWRLNNATRAREQHRRWYADHPQYEQERWRRDPETGKAKNRRTYAKHRAKRIVAQAAYNVANRDTIARYKRAWDRKNPQRNAAYRNIRRARKRLVGGRYTVADVEALFAAQRGRCLYCGRALKKYHVDHKTPLSRGGSNGPENLALACVRCNLRKRTRTEAEFRALLAA